MKNPQKYLIKILFLVILVEALIFTIVSYSKAQNSKSIDFYKGEYKKLIQEYQKKEYSSTHVIFHRFGEKLYHELEIEGLTVCDKSFGFGCFHGFFSYALADQGPRLLFKLEKVCLDKFGEGGLGCQHGIGHGILEFFGHKNLIEALDACSTLSWQGKMFGCRDGVFMEYNFPTLIEDGKASVSRREFDKGNPYDPCPKLPDKYRYSCYYSLGQWWARIFNDDFKRLGELCQKIKDVEERKVCFLGIGNTIPTADELSIARARDLCKTMPTIEGQVACRASAAWSIFAITGNKVQLEMCEGFLENELKQCLGSSDLYVESKK